MKRIFTSSVVLLAFLLSAFCTMAQNDIVTTITPKVRMFPSSGFSYLDDPGRYFNIQMINTTSEVKDIFFTIELSCDFSATGENFYLNTKKNYQPVKPISIGATPVSLNRSHFDQIIGNLNANAYETNADKATLINRVLTLPEGQYRFCITPYAWTGHNDLNPIQLGQKVCYTFTICYSGSAPELTTPVNGFSAANLNNSNPANNLLRRGTVSTTSPSAKLNITNSIPTSDNRSSDQYTVLPLQRTLTFNWTGVISNCLAVNDFNYTLKIVEVYQNQNVQDAINQNATIATIDNKSKTTYQHDTVSNRHFYLQRGHVYAAQVQATLKNTMLSDVRLSNDGKSQVIAFVWGEGPIEQEVGGSITTNVTNNMEAVAKGILEPYLVNPGKDRSANTNTTKSKKGTTASESEESGPGKFVTSGKDSYYQLDKDNDLPVSWMPVRGDSVLGVSYIVSLYEYVGGEVANSMNVQPLARKTIDKMLPDANFSLDNSTLLSLTENWADKLVEGYKYVLNLKTEVDYSYNQKTTYGITEYIHNMPTTRDSVENQVMFASIEYESNVVFAWGIDSGTLDKVMPPQFTYPVDLSGKSWEDTTWTELPDVTKRESFSFRWKSASGIDYGDNVTYKLSVAELPKGKKPEQVTKMLFEKEGITTTDYIDSVLFDTLKTGKQYLARVQVFVKQVGDTSSHYDFLNGGKSHYATFKLVDPPAFVADLNNKLKCSPNALDNLSKEIITPKADSLVNNKVKLKMGSFPLVMQTCKYDEKKQTYSGDGYVIWHPLGVDVRLKVKVDSIQINKNFEIVKGTAVSTATDSSTYLSALSNDLEMDKWSNDDINAVVSKLGENKDIKNFYNKLQKYGEKCAKKFGGLLGPIYGENTATPVLTFPLSITDADITGSDNVIFAINNMYFSPVTALMNIWAIFAAQSDNAYVPFLANNICMDQQRLLGGSDAHIELYMGRDYEITLNDGYKMRFKKSSTFSDPKDGTVLVVDKGKMDYLMAEIQFDMDSKDMMGIEADGTPRKGKIVRADLLAKITDWDNWVAKITMDPFAVVGADRFTFVPTGKGIYYDHSATETPKEVTFPDGYFTSGGSSSKSGSGSKGNDKTNKEWQGFYWDELTVFLSDEISNTFVDESNKKDSMVTYSYGINGTIVDSAHYYYPGSRINFGAKGVLIDKNGFTAELFARDLVRASTKDGGGWAFSLDTISVKFLKNKYKSAIIKGGFGVPLLSGGLRYNCSIGADSLTFSIKSAEKQLKLDLWAATVNLDNKSSKFNIKKVYKEDKTRIDLSLFGKINVDFKKIGVPINCSLAKFEHMGFRNYNSSKPKAGTASVDKFEFDIGAWSFASPQKTLGGDPSDGNGEQVAPADNTLGSVSFGGFTFSLTKFDPIVNFVGTNLKLGFSVAGEIKFATAGADLGAECGFSVWGVVNPKNRFHVEKVDASLNKIKFKDIDFEVFKLNGELEFFNSKSNPNPISSSNNNGFGGSLSVSFMSKVTLSMKVGFGSTTSGSTTYTWWYFDGACKFVDGIPLGAVSINGFSGGFAYNMKPKNSISSSQYNAVNLLKVADKNTSDTKTCSSGMEFVPAQNNWVANAGISLVLTGAENTMNADGLVSLRIANKHFSGIFIDANAYVLTKMDKSATPGDGKNNTSPLVTARAIIGFETTKVYDYFRLSISANIKADLSKLLEGASSNVVGSLLSGAHSGSSLTTGSSVNKSLNELDSKKSGLSDHSQSQRESAAESSMGSGSSKPTLNVSAVIPIDFELKHYKKKDGSHKANSTDWYFAIGKPKYEERVQLSAELNMVVCSAKAEFTFYMQTGNAFAYQMPPLSQDLQNFFGISNSKKKMDTDKEQIKNKRKISNNDWLSIDKGGGFCMGSTFHSELKLDFFLYVHVKADLGFDVALLDVAGTGCPGHAQIGKNNFYAMGQVYAALQGDVGLKVNLGFWKGEFSLFSAGIGALLQGGGPNPSYAYGMLRFKVRLLGGLIKFSSSVDFKVGEVCVPGAGDPLANVKLFQNVTPGYSTEASAKTSSNQQSPLQIGVIVSNMPWDQEVYLADDKGKNARRFYFTLIENNVKYQTRQSASGSYTTTVGMKKLKFYPSRDDDNTLFFETEEGGFAENVYSKMYLEARGFEWRQTVPAKELKANENGMGKDCPYYVSGTSKGKMKSSTSSYDWFDPTFYDEKSGKKIIKQYKKDTTLYFKTKALDPKLDNMVVYSWPYNGDRMFPNKEYVHSGTQPYAMLYLFQQRDAIFSTTQLNNSGKQLKIFMLRYNGESGDVDECTYSYYPNAAVPYVKVKLPKKEYGVDGTGPHKLKFILLDKNAYASALAAAEKAAQITQKKAEYQSRILNSTYTSAQDAHKANSSGKTSSSGKKTLNLKNQQLEQIYQHKQSFGKDSMTYYRTKMKDNYKAASSVGDVVYEWTWFSDFNYETYHEYFTQKFSEGCYDADYKAGRQMNYRKLASDLKGATVTSNSSSNTIKFRSSYAYWLFLPYDPQDKSRYNTNCEMPPRFYMALNNGGDYSLNRIHSAYFQNFIDMERDFKQTNLMTLRHSDDKGSVDFYRNPNSTISDPNLVSEFKRVLANGFTRNYGCSFSNIDIRIKGGTNFTRCDANGYHPTTIDVPCLLTINSTQEIEPMDDKYFDPKYSSKLSIGNGENIYRNLTIYDYAMHAIINDIKMFHDFMQHRQQHAEALNNRGWSHKVDFFKDFYSSKYRTARFSLADFPFDIPEIYIVTHYMVPLDHMWLAEKNSYYTTLGDYLNFYNKEGDFIWASDLQLQDRYWAKYWWSSAGQCLSRFGNGFDRDFYAYKDNHKYYNVRYNQANKGKHVTYNTKSSVLGSWYNTDMYTWLGKTIRNTVKFYYMTSQQSGLEDNLLKVAQAVRAGKVQTSKIFYPNAVIVPSECYYDVSLDYTTQNKLKNSGKITVKSNDSDTGFNY